LSYRLHFTTLILNYLGNSEKTLTATFRSPIGAPDYTTRNHHGEPLRSFANQNGRPEAPPIAVQQPYEGIQAKETAMNLIIFLLVSAIF